MATTISNAIKIAVAKVAIALPFVCAHVLLLNTVFFVFFCSFIFTSIYSLYFYSLSFSLSLRSFVFIWVQFDRPFFYSLRWPYYLTVFITKIGAIRFFFQFLFRPFPNAQQKSISIFNGDCVNDRNFTTVAFVISHLLNLIHCTKKNK